MLETQMSAVVRTELNELSRMVEFFLYSRWAQNEGKPGNCDFMLGNPQEGVVAGFAEALQTWAPPRRTDWFAYKLSEPAAQRVAAESLERQTGVAFDPDDIAMTNGAWGALAVSLRAVVDAGDEVIYINPPWFFYRTLIRTAGGTPVEVDVRPSDFDLDLEAIAGAITPRTRAILINQPHNPTGRVFSRERFDELATLLSEASRRNNRTIYAISDEAYRRIIFDNGKCPTLAASYPATFLIYTYGKTLLIPGQRIGYIAMPPQFPDRETFRTALLMAQIITGYAFPNALLQHAISDFDELSIDLDHYQVKRDRVVASLREQGYETTSPQGTFYVLVKSPIDDEAHFCEQLADRDVFVLPGYVFDMPGYFRISLTATDDMIERALPVFAEAIRSLAVVNRT